MTWETKLFTLHDDLTHRIAHCCRKLDWTPVSGSCGTCRLDGQLRGMLSRYIEAGKMKRPPGVPSPIPLKIINPLPADAEGSGIAPLSAAEKTDFQRKLSGASAAAAGGRR